MKHIISDYGMVVGTWNKGDIVRISLDGGTSIFLLLTDPDPTGRAIWLDKFGYSERLVDKRSWSNAAEAL